MGTRMERHGENWRAMLLASASLMGVRRPEMLGENQKALSSASLTDAHPPWTMTLLCCPRVQQCSTMIILIRMITQPTLPLQSTGTATITTCQNSHPSHHPSHPHPRPSNNNNNNSSPLPLPHHTHPPTHQYPLPCKPHQNPHHHHNHQAHPNLTHPLQKSSYPIHRPTSPWQQPSHLRPASR